MKKTVLLILILLLGFTVFSAYAQEIEVDIDTSAEEIPEPEQFSEEEETVPLAQRFPTIRIRDQFNAYIPIMYYRFSPDVLFFDSIDLSYFPHEKWSKNNWVLLGRWTDGISYNQILYGNSPMEKLTMHGTDTGGSRGIYRDFYMYATLFIEDNYPQDSGSCYVYYSDSLMVGLKESKGILIDPETGIYEATNSYGGARHSTYTPNTIKHSLELIQELDPDNYTFDPENIAASSIGAVEYPQLAVDEQFTHDYEAITGAFHMKASPEVKTYRVEVVRENGISTIYINGVRVYSSSDNLKTTDENGELIPERVSWSYGPILNEEGLTVTCALGDFIVTTPVQ